MPTQIQLRRGTAAQWTSANPILASGEVGLETDTGKTKTGNGGTAWTGLAYSVGAGSVIVQEADVQVSGAAATLDFGHGLDVSESPAGEANIDVDESELTHNSLGGRSTATAHPATAISVDSTTLVGTGTTVQAVFEELDDAAAAHLADTLDAHDASAISILDTANDFTATDVEGALAELQSDNEAHVAAADPHVGYVKETTAQVFSLAGTFLDTTAARNVLIFRAPFPCVVTGVQVHVKAGTSATVNARKNGASNFLASNLTGNTGQWTATTTVQNTSVATGDDVELMLVSVSGVPTEIVIQVDLTRLLA